MPKEKILAIDIGNYSTKLVYKLGDKIKDMTFIETPLGVYQDGRVTNADKMAECLKEIIKANKYKAKELAVVVNSSMCIIRQFSLPLLREDNEIKGALELQISETLSTIMDSHTLSYKIYETSSETISGILVLMPNDIIASYVNLAELLGLDPKYLDIHSNCAAKYYKYAIYGNIKAQNAIMIDFGDCSTNIMLVTKGKVLFNRFIPGGINMIDEMLERELGLTKEQALQCRFMRFEQFGIQLDDMKKYVRLSCMRIEDEIRQVIDYFGYNKFEGKIEAIILHGNGARLDLFANHLKTENTIPVYRLKSEELPFVNTLGSIVREGSIKEKKENQPQKESQPKREKSKASREGNEKVTQDTNQ